MFRMAYPGSVDGEAPNEKKHYSRAMRVFFLLLLTLSACDPANQFAALDTVKLVALLGLTNDPLGAAPNLRDAATLAVEQINASGGVFDGRQLELIVRDTESDAELAANLARTAIEDDDAAIILGPMTSGESLRARDIIDGAEIPFISPSATSASLSRAGEDWFFRTTPSDILQAQALAYVAAEGTTVANESIAPCPEAVALYRDDAYGNGLGQQFADEFRARGGTVVGELAFSTDLSGGVASVLAPLQTQFVGNHTIGARVCVVVVAFSENGLELLPALEAMLNAADATSYQFYGTDGLKEVKFARVLNNFAGSIFMTAPTHADNLAYEKFKNALHARFGDDEPANFSFNMFDAAMLGGLAITKAGSTDPFDIRDALFAVSRGGQRMEGRFFGEVAEAILSGNDIDYVGPSGELDFDEAGDVQGDYGLARPVRVDSQTFDIEVVGRLPLADFVR